MTCKFCKVLCSLRAETCLPFTTISPLSNTVAGTYKYSIIHRVCSRIVHLHAVASNREFRDSKTSTEIKRVTTIALFVIHPKASTYYSTDNLHTYFGGYQVLSN